jgi:hypothetical protein
VSIAPKSRNGRRTLTGKNSFSIDANLSGLDALFDQLGDEFEEAARPAAQAAAQVLYDEVKKNVQAIGKKTGKLDASIYQAYSASQSAPGKATYHISWNHKKAPHGHLLEYGYLQRYKYYQNARGQVRVMVRPGMDGTKRPGRGASQAVKDAYYVTLPTPIQVPAKAFMRRAIDKFPAAYAAAEAELIKRINGGGA